MSNAEMILAGLIPADIVAAAEKVGDYFKLHGIENWQLHRIESRGYQSDRITMLIARLRNEADQARNSSGACLVRGSPEGRANAAAIDRIADAIETALGMKSREHGRADRRAVDKNPDNG